MAQGNREGLRDCRQELCAGKFVTIRDLMLLDLTKTPELPRQDIFDPNCGEP